MELETEIFGGVVTRLSVRPLSGMKDAIFTSMPAGKYVVEFRWRYSETI